MGENNDLYFEKVLLKNIDEDIPINVDLSNTPEKSSVSTIRTSKSELKNEILLELQHRFPVEKKENEHLEKFIQSLNDQISTLNSEINFLREELKEKDHVIRLLLNMRCKPSENCGTTFCSNHPSGKYSDRSNNKDINNNRRINKINDNISNNKISNNNINNNNTSNNNISDNYNINNYNISNNNNEINTNNNDNIGNIINNNNNDNISNNKISTNNVTNSNTSYNNINNNNNNNNNINNINNSNNDISNNYNDVNNNNNNNTSNNINNNINDNINNISNNNNNINNNIKSSDTNTDVSNRILIMGDSIVKHVRGYELSRKVENCKVCQELFKGKDYVYGGLRKTNTERNAHSYHSPCWNE